MQAGRRALPAAGRFQADPAVCCRTAEPLWPEEERAAELGELRPPTRTHKEQTPRESETRQAEKGSKSSRSAGDAAAVLL
jgi:hypothetical protein